MLFSWDLHTFILFLVTILLGYYFLRRKETRNLAPGPLTLPVVGSLLSLARKQKKHKSTIRYCLYLENPYDHEHYSKRLKQETSIKCSVAKIYSRNISVNAIVSTCTELPNDYFKVALRMVFICLRFLNVICTI